MISRLKRLFRTALDRELGVLGEDLATARDAHDALVERFERLQARIGMRQIRDDRSAAKRPQMSDAELRALMKEPPAQQRRVVSEWPDLEQ